MKLKYILGMILIPILATLLIGCSTEPLTMKIQDSNAFSSAKTITILDFSTEGANIVYEGNADSLGNALAELLQQELQKKANYLDVTLGNKEATDLIVEGGFTKIDEGDAAARGVTIRLDGVVKKSDGTVVANFNANKESLGGPLGTGGLLAGDSDAIIEDLLNEIADELSDFIVAKTTRSQR
jgi:hypothetical protein